MDQNAYRNPCLFTGSVICLVGGCVLGLLCGGSLFVVLARFMDPRGPSTSGTVVAFLLMGALSLLPVLFSVLAVIVGGLGLSRSKRPESHGFFFGWGLGLLLLGLPVFLLTGILFPFGFLFFPFQIGAPVLFLVGSVQSRQEQSRREQIGVSPTLQDPWQPHHYQ